MCYGCCCCGFSDQDGKFKALEIALIALHCLSIILLILCLAFISWDELNSTCLALFIVMLVLIVGKLIIASFIRHWGSSGLNKTTKKETVFCLCIFGVVLVVINFVICIIAETVTTSAFIKANFPCTDDLKKSLQNFDTRHCVRTSPISRNLSDRLSSSAFSRRGTKGKRPTSGC